MKILACMIALAISAAALPALAQANAAPASPNGGPSVNSMPSGTPRATTQARHKHRKHKNKRRHRDANRAGAPAVVPGTRLN